MQKGIYMNTEYLEKFFRNILLGENNELKNRYTHVDYDEYIKKFGENAKSSEKKFGDNQKSSEIILELLKENPKLSAKKLSEKIGITSRAVEKQLASLVEKGLIKREGSPKGGHWEVIE
jgi:predicted HTH transcriptional regulator